MDLDTKKAQTLFPPWFFIFGHFTHTHIKHTSHFHFILQVHFLTQAKTPSPPLKSQEHISLHSTSPFQEASPHTPTLQGLQLLVLGEKYY